MICNLCGTTGKWFKAKQYNQPDKYEAYVGIDLPICRRWYRCLSCGLYQSQRTYPIEKLMPIYTNGYRDEAFRGESLAETFEKVNSLPKRESENLLRVWWLAFQKIGNSLLDIGSGFGVFPYQMKRFGLDVVCLEPNEDSAAFINGYLKMVCHNATFQDAVSWLPKFEVVSAVHVLEHVTDPETFLKDIQRVLLPGGKLFLEVPDAVEFDYLPDDHDEFNSTHLTFFDTSTLYKMVEYAGYKVTDIHRVHHKARDLSRILLLAERQG